MFLLARSRYTGRLCGVVDTIRIHDSIRCSVPIGEIRFNINPLLLSILSTALHLWIYQAPVLAYISNIVEIRTDASKLLYIFRYF